MTCDDALISKSLQKGPSIERTSPKHRILVLLLFKCVSGVTKQRQLQGRGQECPLFGGIMCIIQTLYQWRVGIRCHMSPCLVENLPHCIILLLYLHILVIERYIKNVQIHNISSSIPYSIMIGSPDTRNV